MAQYTYQQENGEYVFYEDGKPLKTPDGAAIKTHNEQLAKQLLADLENDAGYKSPTSFLTYFCTPE